MRPANYLQRFLIALVVFVTLAIGVWAPVALAHTEFESSDPADGAELDHPIEQITLVFTAASTEAGDGFLVLAPDGTLLVPEVTVSEDQRRFVLSLPEPLVAGEIGVRWSVRAGDAHPIEGSFSFTTTAPRPSATPVPASIPRPTSTTPGEALDPDIAPDRAESSTATAGEMATSPQPTDPTQEPTQAPVDLDTFLAGKAQGRSAGDAIGFVGRTVALIGALLAIGVTVISVRGTGRDLAGHLVPLILVGAGALFVGSLAEAGGFLVNGEADVLGGRPGLAVGLRAAAALAIGIAASRRGPTLGLIGAVPALASYLFDGHTVTEGNRALTAVLDVVHVIGGAVWVGGIVAIVYLARKGPAPSRAFLGSLIAEFSRLAGVALAAVGIGGVALSVTILDSFSDLWATTWGRTLLAKVLFVVAASVIGAYNHFFLVPSGHQGDRTAITRVTRLARTEALLLTVVVILTAALVVAAT